MPSNSNTTDLFGLWVVISDGGDGYGLAGQITRSIGDYHVIKMNGPLPSSKLMASDALCGDQTFFFDSESELLAWLAWEPDGDKPRVVPLHPSTDRRLT